MREIVNDPRRFLPARVFPGHFMGCPRQLSTSILTIPRRLCNLPLISFNKNLSFTWSEDDCTTHGKRLHFKKAASNRFMELCFPRLDLGDMWKLLHPASAHSCDIIQQHPHRGSDSCSHHSHGCRLAGGDRQMVRSKELFLLEK